MKKTRATVAVAAACACLAGPAVAQTSVVLYGIADGNFRLDHTNVGTLKSIDSGGESGSRWGIRGIEELGGGLKATFIFEQGIDITDNASPQGNIGAGASGGFGGASTAPHSSTGSRLFSRVASVGLATPFGELKFGRNYNPLFLAQFGADPYAAGLVSGVNSIFINNTLRNDNAIYYDSPKLYGFQFLGTYQFGESTTNNTVNAATGQAKRGNERIGAGVLYNNGPLFAGIGYERIRSNLDLYRVQTYDATAAYDFNIVKLHALYWRTENDNPNATAAFGSTVRLSQRVYMLGATVPFGAWTFIGSYALLRDHSTSNVNTDLGRPWSGTIGAAAKYSLSKRTVLYAAYARMNVKRGPAGNAFQGFNGFTDASNAGLFTAANLSGPNVNPWSYQMGIRHSF